MAPEQALDLTSIDARADIYALGCTLYYLLTGQPPYTAGSLMGLLLKHRDAPIPALGALRPDVPVELESIYRRMVAKQPGDRLAPMTAVVEALEGVQGKVVALRTRPGAPQRAPASPPSGEATVDAESAEQLLAKERLAGTCSESETPSQTLSGRGRQTTLTVVVAEPSRTQAAIVRKYLRDLGIDRVHSTGSGAEALTLAVQHQAHVVLSAFHLADMTGVQLVQALRAEARFADVGFVLASSESHSSEALAILATPRTRVLSKPFDLRQLAGALAEAAACSPEVLLAGRQ
jgi:CheY-like chemotaxis protein